MAISLMNILGGLYLLGHDIGQGAAHAHSTCRTILFATSSKIWGGWLQSLVTAKR